METTIPQPEPILQTGLDPSADTSFTSKYELLGEIGRGGMGIVYRGRHRRLEMPVAVKVMLPIAASERFLREARCLAQVRSPHVVAVHDCEILANGCPVLVMEWVEGTDLAKVLRGATGPLPEDRVLPWMRHTCEGMAAAHERGIVHRDLKPSNLLIDAQGKARVADFGLARAPALAGDLSQSGALMGTPHYMAPEQAEDPRGVDTRADVYSFGATFYHALTGRPPFDGDTAFTVLYRHKTEPLPAPRFLNPRLTERTGEVLERCLAKAPAERFPSFADVLRFLDPATGGRSPWAASEDRELAPFLVRYHSRRLAYLAERIDQELDVYTFPRGQTLRIVRGNLVTQPSEVFVSSDTYHLNMAVGVSAAIAAAAGPDVADHARRLAPVRPGRVAVTPAGNLSARLIYHAVTVGYVGNEVVTPSRDLIAELMASCFYHADSQNVRSIAFPLLGTGSMRYDRGMCLDTMFQFLARTFLHGLTTVQEARIVLYGQRSE